MRLRFGTFWACGVVVAAAGCSAGFGTDSEGNHAKAPSRTMAAARSRAKAGQDVGDQRQGQGFHQDDGNSAAGNDSDGEGCHGEDADGCQVVHATVVATGIPGAGAIAQIGDFLRSSPIHDKPAFAAYAQPGHVLDRARLLVASSSNFGAPLGNTAQYPGSVLSIDPGSSSPIAVPAAFAAGGDQASALGGLVQVYAANGPTFLNSRFEPGAATAGQVSVSLPLGISINSGNGRPWLANAPKGAAGEGTITVLDPDGAPLAGAPDTVAGGVFAGNETNRSANSTHGLVSGAVGTAIFTKSPDGTGKAVFAAVEADGSIVQVHVKDGVDGLVPPGTLSTFPTLTPDAVASIDPHVVTRAGIAFNWVPTRTLYVADGKANRLVAFDITDDGTLFIASAARFIDAHGRLRVPVDVAPTEREIASENFSSNSTLGGGADLYVLNRGNNRVVRVTATGEVKGVREIAVDGMDRDDFRVAGLSTSPDGQVIWVTATTKGGGGMVLSIAGFGSGPVMPGLMAGANAAGATGSTTALGSHFFSHAFTPAESVGPLFNATSCAGCHSDPIAGGMGDSIFDTQVGEDKSGVFSPLENNRGPVERQHAIAELGASSCSLKAPDLPHDANAFSKRSTMTLRGTSLIDFIQGKDILANQAAEAPAIQGHPNILPDGRIGKFGWKAGTATLVEFMGQAFRNEVGLTNNIAPVDETDACGANAIKPEIDAVPLETTAAFLASIDPPAPAASCLASPGATVFASAGCNGCHTPSMPGPGFTAHLYSDLLVHDMGPALADGFVSGSAKGSEFRTMTLVSMGERAHFLHDGRASTIAQAILDHGGQGAAAASTFSGLSATDQEALLAFVGCL